ncbi:paraquat-inducible protein A [Phaeobacter sp. B1627]|uniref:paraquat-inducible protein A n=1 Tax=Phaeobacter sp. B1627 TaxID=2583809 RepID=UPI00111AE8F5|nr:paraquat-inducible protein A [Phaeobacter sp. B1627]TNJ43354.1 paraquat-inducible membrane protein A [Phaeobacter sp. B1627]
MSDRADVLTARDAGLVGCRDCTRAWPVTTEICPCCGSALVSRDSGSLQRVWAWWLVALICYVPANIYPMLRTSTLGSVSQDTIVGGAITLAEHGSYSVAAIILLASVVIPTLKFLAIAYLAISVARPASTRPRTQHLLYEMVEYIGRWSMIDVFVVAILSALVHLGSIASVEPGPASLTFALTVVFTMISAQSFDSRLIWDQLEDEKDDTLAP